MSYASSFNNMRMNGTGRLYISDVGATDPGVEVGEIDGLSDSISVSEDKIYSNRTAGKVVIGTVANETEASLSFGAREQTEFNLQMGYQAGAASDSSQLAGALDAVEKTLVEGAYLDMGKTDCFLTRLTIGAVTGGPFVAGETVTGGTSTATGKVAWTETGLLELINVTGTFVVGETLTGGTSTASAAIATVNKVNDMVVTNNAATPTTRYELGTDYDLDADYGYIRKASGSTIAAAVFISADHAAMTKHTIHAMSAQGTEKRLVFVSDKNDKGRRMRYTYHRVSLTLNGEAQKIGSGEQVIPIQGTIMADTSKPTGQQFISVEVFG